MKKILFGKAIMEVSLEDEYIRKSELEKNNTNIESDITKNTMIEKNGYIYPITKIDETNKENDINAVGVFDFGPILLYNKPNTEEEENIYNANNCIDFENLNNIQNTIEKIAENNKDNNMLVVDEDNIYNLPITEDDTPEFALLKEAINKKRINIDDYKDKLSDSFSNNIRLLINNNSITFSKLRMFCDVFDIDCEITLKDREGAINPIGETISTPIT